MTVKDFEKKYGELGGIAKLTELRSLLFSQDYIAKHFKVSKQRVRQWMLEFFGSVYDSREDREEAIKLSMMDFAKNNGVEEFGRAFRDSPYYEKVLREINK